MNLSYIKTQYTIEGYHPTSIISYLMNIAKFVAPSSGEKKSWNGNQIGSANQKPGFQSLH